MDSEAIMWFLLMIAALLVGTPIVHSLLIKYNVLPTPFPRREALLISGDEHALWEYRIASILKLSLFHLILAASFISLHLIRAFQSPIGLIKATDMLLPAIFALSALIQLAIAVWQLNMGWDRARHSAMGRTGRAMIEKHNRHRTFPEGAAHK